MLKAAVESTFTLIMNQKGKWKRCQCKEELEWQMSMQSEQTFKGLFITQEALTHASAPKRHCCVKYLRLRKITASL